MSTTMMVIRLSLTWQLLTNARIPYIFINVVSIHHRFNTIAIITVLSTEVIRMWLSIYPGVTVRLLTVDPFVNRSTGL